MTHQDPEADPWTAAMRRGDFESAWLIKDEELKRRLAAAPIYWHQLPRHLQSVWNGEPLAGKSVLVRCYHGLGDTLQFIRFLSPLHQSARSVVLWVQPALIDLARTAPGLDFAFPLHDGVPEIEHDADVEITELPHALRINSIPAEIPFLFPPKPLERRGGAFSIGLVWQAGNWDPHRSISTAEIGRLARVGGVELYSLQYPRPVEPIPFQDISRRAILPYAAQMLKLDLIISVDTMAAHLAGALGCRTWTLLHKDCDWRWPTECAKTPWYPTMRLFHQRRAGDWSSVIDEVCAALTSISSSHR